MTIPAAEYNEIKERAMSKKVIAAGHICIDITPAFPARKVKAVGDILAPGKLIEVGAADAHTGGSVANTGLAMKIFGAEQHFRRWIAESRRML